MGLVNVYEGGDEYGNGKKVVARVKYNSCLDHWDGHNWTNGSTGRHLGITRLKNKKFVLIHGTQWQGDKDHAEIVSDEDALQAILDNDPDELKNWPDLQKLADEKLIGEEVKEDI